MPVLLGPVMEQFALSRLTQVKIGSSSLLLRLIAYSPRCSSSGSIPMQSFTAFFNLCLHPRYFSGASLASELCVIVRLRRPASPAS